MTLWANIANLVTGSGGGRRAFTDTGAAHTFKAYGDAGEDLTNNVKIVEQGRFARELVAAGVTDQVLGTTGAINDYLNHLVVQVNTTATSQVMLGDGVAAAEIIVPANTPVGVHVVAINHKASVGGWRVTTAAGVTVYAVGRFT